jgi:hypothetical protein
MPKPSSDIRGYQVTGSGSEKRTTSMITPLALHFQSNTTIEINNINVRKQNQWDSTRRMQFSARWLACSTRPNSILRQSFMYLT